MQAILTKTIIRRPRNDEIIYVVTMVIEEQTDPVLNLELI